MDKKLKSLIAVVTLLAVLSPNAFCNFLGDGFRKKIVAEDVKIDTSNFVGNLSSSDSDLQTMAETVDAITAGSGAPTNATYITQTPSGSLSAEQALSTLSSGICRVATTTGVITSLTDSSGIAANISDETGSGALVFATSPTLVTPILGTPTSGTLTNCTGLPVAGITASTSTALGVGSVELGHATDTTLARSGAGAVTVEGVQVLLSGAALGTPSSGTLTNCTGLPAASVVAGTLGTGSFVVPGTLNYTNNAITASGNAATVPITSKFNTVTNNSAATLTITMTTTSAVNGQLVIVNVLDASAAAQTITWVNTENSTNASVPTTSNGSTTLPKVVGFQYNSATSKWRCIAST